MVVNNFEVDNNQIYKINKIKTYEDYVFVYLDKDKIQVSIDDYFKYKLSNVNEINEETLSILKDNEKFLKAYRSCLRKLSIKDYTIKQIKTHLKKYDISLNDIDTIINKLLDYKLLDDEKYCINRINILNNQSLSNKQIKTKLIKDGIDPQLIEKNLKLDLNNEQDKCDKLAVKYEKSITNKSLNAKKQVIISKLVANGFTYDMANSSMYKLSINADNELELLSKEYLKVMNKYSKKYSDYELRNKIYSSLLSKGFKSDDIKKIMEV